jgi:sensor histidine kinase regulating citrate/malate metabolism
VVTLAFSLILINQIEAATRANLLTNAKVLDLAISRFKEEALAKARFLAARADIKDALVRNKFLELESLTKESLEDEKLGFLTILNKEGEVILRAHALTQREDNLSRESAVRSALAGKEIVTIESSPAEEFSIRAAAPIFSQGKIAGVIIAGFLLDNALVDNIKRITGLEMSIYEMDIVVATTLLNPDGRTRSTGSKVVDLQVKENVLTQGQEITLRTEILSRPALASYLPLKNSEEKIIGMISSLKPQQEILALANAVNRLTLVTVAVLMLLSVLPIYLFTRRLSLEVT